MTFLYENLNGFFSLLDLFDIEKLMEPSQNSMDCIFVKIRYVTQIPKGQENVLAFFLIYLRVFEGNINLNDPGTYISRLGEYKSIYIYY